MDTYELVVKACRQKGTTIAALERALHFSVGSIIKWKTSSPSADKILTIANYFNMSIDYFYGRDETTGEPLDDVKIALYNAADGISEQGQKDILEYIELIKLREKNKK